MAIQYQVLLVNSNNQLNTMKYGDAKQAIMKGGSFKRILNYSI